MSDEPVLLTLNIGNFMSGEPPIIASWQLPLSLVPSDGAVGAMTVENAIPIDPSLFGVNADYLAVGLGTSTPMILDQDKTSVGVQIEENQERGITELELSHSSDASGTFILSMPPFVLDKIDLSPFWLELTNAGTSFEIRPFENTPAASGLIELARFTVQRSTIEGDYNGDLVVDAADYTVWRDNLGTPGFTLEQYAVWKEHFGESASGPLSNAVPEPTGWLLIVLCGLSTVIFTSRGLRSRISG
jgi:hypothetical protein